MYYVHTMLENLTDGTTYCLALRDEIFDKFPLCDETHKEICISVIRQKTAKSAKTFQTVHIRLYCTITFYSALLCSIISISGLYDVHGMFQRLITPRWTKHIRLFLAHNFWSWWGKWAWEIQGRGVVKFNICVVRRDYLGIDIEYFHQCTDISVYSNITFLKESSLIILF